MGEIASPLCESRNCGREHCTRPQTEAFIATKDESLVFDHWPADRGPKLILGEGRRLVLLAELYLLSLIKKLVGVEKLIPEILIS